MSSLNSENSRWHNFSSSAGSNKKAKYNHSHTQAKHYEMPIDSDTFGVKQAIVSKIILINSEHDIDNISEISDTSEQNVLLAVTKLMDIFFPMPFQCKRHKTNRNFDASSPKVTSNPNFGPGPLIRKDMTQCTTIGACAR